MPKYTTTTQHRTTRIGAVKYLNARPLTFCLDRREDRFDVIFDLPSRLADGLAAGDIDVALIPSIEYARNQDYTIVSDACVACDGPVRSVKLYGRVPPENIQTLALDEGSRTSAAMTQIVLRERFGIRPAIEPLSIGASADDADADAVMLIGDRGMHPPAGEFQFVWDLGEEWSRWTGLPFVFAMWVARPHIELGDVARILSAARDEGVRRIPEIARDEHPALGVSESECLAYLQRNLEFHLGERQLSGLRRFYELASLHDFAPSDAVDRL